MIVLAFILVAVGLFILLFSGTARAVFELVLIFDNQKNLRRKEFFDKSKDANNDGKVSWWEATFPNEKVHGVKRLEMICAGIGCTFLLAGLFLFLNELQWLNIYTFIGLLILNPIIFFATTGWGFDTYFKNNRPKK